LSKAEIRRLKALAQNLKATFKVGRQGLTPSFLQGVETALLHHEVVKVKFDEFKEERETLAPELAARTGSHLVGLIGHVALLHRPRPAPAQG
jgi:RNA-binding protein